MSAATRRPAGPRRLRDVHARPVDVSSPTHVVRSTVNPHERGGRVVFEIGFTSAMADADLELLGRLLGMATHRDRKLRVDPNSPAVTRLDHYSGLFLERAAAENQWLLQARTWGTPSAQTIHEWQVQAALVVGQLDPATAIPAAPRSSQPELPQRPVGTAASARLARLRRRLVGLP